MFSTVGFTLPTPSPDLTPPSRRDTKGVVVGQSRVCSVEEGWGTSVSWVDGGRLFDLPSVTSWVTRDSDLLFPRTGHLCVSPVRTIGQCSTTDRGPTILSDRCRDPSHRTMSRMGDHGIST